MDICKILENFDHESAALISTSNSINEAISMLISNFSQDKAQKQTSSTRLAYQYNTGVKNVTKNLNKIFNEDEALSRRNAGSRESELKESVKLIRSTK